ncbi:MAG: AAA family ATPase [Anaerolineae bacterium]|nr:AAA family ATPase [Anaerolineae bacterium]
MPNLVDTLASYVPQLITRRLAVDPTPITAPMTERIPAAVLYADISGFTTMAEQLAPCGPSGTEQLTDRLNTYFGQLVDCIAEHGGDVVKFSGDGLLAFWPAYPGLAAEMSPQAHRRKWAAMRQTMADETYRATQCAVAVQTLLHQYEQATGFPLAARLNIGAGEVLVMHLGGVYSRWEFLISGTPIHQITTLDRQPDPGLICLSPEAWMLVQDKCRGQRLLGGHVNLEALGEPLPLRPRLPDPLPTAGEVALRPYIPAAILSRISAGQNGWLAEMRRITTLFVNLPDITATTPLAEAQAAIHGLQKALYRYEGSINKISVDKKGISLVAAMGLPPLAHQDDALRGVKAALAMVDQLQAADIRCTIGITTGNVFCGSVGNTARREYTLIGSAVNQAAQLMQAVRQQPTLLIDLPILCDEATYQATRAEIAYSAPQRLGLSGQGRAAPVFCPAPTATQTIKLSTETLTAAGAVFGRSAEQQQLAAALQTLVHNHLEGKIERRIMVIEGSAGIGKSTLVSDMVSRAARMQVETWIGSGNAIEKSTPYYAWRSVFSRIFQLDTTHSDFNVQRQHVLTQLAARFSAAPDTAAGPDRVRLAPLLNAVLPLDLPENSFTRQLRGQVRAVNTEELLIDILRVVAAEQPTLLVIEDVHWLDSASWALLRRVSRQVRPLLLVITARPPGEDTLLTPDWRGILNPSLLAREAYESFLTSTPVERLALESLRLEDMLQLVCARLEVDALPRPVASLIAERAEGHPFFSEELAFVMRDSGLLDVGNGTCRLTRKGASFFTLSESERAGTDLTLPNTVESAIVSRVDRLTPSQSLALKVASVVGRIFALQVVQAVHPVHTDRPRLQTYIDTLEGLGLISMETPDPELAYFFKHNITQEVIYDQMTATQRRQLHSRVAEWYEQVYAANLAPFYPLLAYHWSQSRSEHKAAHYLEKAGEQALREGAYHEAIRFFGQAVALDDERQRRQATSNRRAGQVEREPFDTAAAAQPPIALDALRRARWERQLGEAYFGLGDLPRSREYLERAVRLLGWPIPAHRTGIMASLVGQILHRVNPASFLAGNPEAMLEAARAYEQLGHIAYFSQDKVLGITAILWGLNLAEGVGASPELARSYANMSIATGIIPLHTKAETFVRQAHDTARQLNQPAVLAWVLFVTSAYELGIGRWPAVERALGQALETFTDLKDRRHEAECRSLLAMATHYQARFDHSAALYADIYDAACQRGDRQAQVWGLVGEAISLWRLGQTDAVRKRLKAAFKLLPTTLDRAEATRAHGLMALIQLRAGHLRAAQEAIDTARQQLADAPTAVKALEGYAAIAEVTCTLFERGRGMSASKVKPLDKAARQACKDLHAFARIFPVAKPRAWLWQGHYDWSCGQQAKALRSWQTCLAEAKALAMPYEQGLAHNAIGHHLPEDDPQRPAHLSQAEALLGMNH